MIDYIRMLRSGLCEYAVEATVQMDYANTTNRLLRAVGRCLADHFRLSELGELEVTI